MNVCCTTAAEFVLNICKSHFVDVTQNALETRMRLSRMPTSQLLLTADYSSHYEIIDSDLHDYILSMDAKAWSRYLRGVKICPFCGSEVIPTSFCCQRFLEFRHSTSAAADGKLHGQEGAKSKGSKSKGKKSGVMEEAKKRSKSHLVTRSV